jgi:hypothetical protein
MPFGWVGWWSCGSFSSGCSSTATRRRLAPMSVCTIAQHSAMFNSRYLWYLLCVRSRGIKINGRIYPLAYA